MDEVKLLIIPCIVVTITSYVIERLLKKCDNKILNNLLVIILGVLFLIGLFLYTGVGFTDDAVIENQYFVETMIPYFLASTLGVVLALIKKK